MVKCTHIIEKSLLPDENRVDISAGQWSQTQKQGSSQPAAETEHKTARIAQFVLYNYS